MSVDITDPEFALLKEFLLTRCGIDIPPEKRYLFVTRLGECLAKNGCRNFSELYLRLSGEGREPIEEELIEAMTTHETSFFRDGHPFETLTRTILPDLARRRAARAQFSLPRIRILSAGCCTGEEPYSIAMCVRDWLDTQSEYGPAQVSVLATDISPAALSHARRGVYRSEQVTNGLPARQREEYVKSDSGGFAIREDVRAMVYFAEVNLSRDFRHLGFFDLILCRNVIIYFPLELRRNIVDTFYDLLTPGGVLLLGASESLYQITKRFQAVHSGPTTYYTRDGGGDEEE
ncbi:MAG: CheR family methyltransferase [Planctomycetota bacterium]